MGGETLGCIEIQPEQVAALASLSPTENLVLPGLLPARELRRFAAGLRLVTVLLCASLLATEQARREHTEAWVVWLVYALWAGGLFWFETTGRTRQGSVWPFWVDVAWSCLAVKLLPAGPVLLAVLLGQPVVLVSIGHGVAQGLMLAAFAMVGMGFQPWRSPLNGPVRPRRRRPQAAQPALPADRLVVAPSHRAWPGPGAARHHGGTAALRPGHRPGHGYCAVRPDH